ncbi:MAG: DUF2752 domain-containing protein, partial [Planctomycetota bacterium]
MGGEERLPSAGTGRGPVRRHLAGSRRLAQLAWAIALLAVFPTARLARPLILGSRTTVCPFRALTGRPCALCGLTRAFARASAGEFRLAFELHPLWWMAAIVVAALAILCLVPVSSGQAEVRAGLLGEMVHGADVPGAVVGESFCP